MLIVHYFPSKVNTLIKDFGNFFVFRLIVHSQAGTGGMEKVEDAGIELGTVVRVKYLGLDKKGRMDFSIKDAE